MSALQERRRRAIADLIRTAPASSQDELAQRLAALGFPATQATISRDLDQIGAVKVRRGGGLSYALPDAVPGVKSPPLTAIFRDWVRSVEAAASLVIIKTPPGSAHLVGVALDNSGLPEIAGTICGDDTIFIACRSAREARLLARRLSGELQ